MYFGMLSRNSHYIFPLMGLVIAGAIARESLMAALALHTYWAAAGVSVFSLAAYFVLVHPRIRSRNGYEYASLIVGTVGAIAALSAIWGALAGYPRN